MKQLFNLLALILTFVIVSSFVPKEKTYTKITTHKVSIENKNVEKIEVVIDSLDLIINIPLEIKLEGKKYKTHRI